MTRAILPEGLYAITAESYSRGRTNLEVVEAMLAAGLRVVQYREKHGKKQFRDMFEELKVIRAMTRQAGALLLVNDYIELALAVDADGVHVGQDDLPPQVVRRLIGPGRLLGVSTHGPQQALAAVQAGADYIGAGPVFATRTKEDVCDPVGLEYLDFVHSKVAIPWVAIGGIKAHNLEQVLAHGAQRVALVTEIVGAEDIGAKIKQLQTIIQKHKNNEVS